MVYLNLTINLHQKSLINESSWSLLIQPPTPEIIDHWITMNHPPWGCWISWWNSVACLWSRCAWNSSKRGALSVAWGTPLACVHRGSRHRDIQWMWKAVRTQMYLGVPWLNDLGPNFIDKTHDWNCGFMDANQMPIITPRVTTFWYIFHRNFTVII